MALLKFGLLVLACTAAQASAASFDCAKAASQAEKTICSDAALSTLDEQLNKSYRAAIVRSGNKVLLREWQRGWLRSPELSACTSSSCMKPIFAAGVKLLDAIVASRWNGQYVRYDAGKPDLHAADIVLVALRDEAVAGRGAALWMGPNAANGQVNVGEFGGQGSFTGEQLIFDSADCQVSMTLKGDVLTVEDSKTCGGANVTFTGQYRRK